MSSARRKADEGVRVYVLLDDFGCVAHRERHGKGLRAFRNEYLENYAERGIQLVFYNKGVKYDDLHLKIMNPYWIPDRKVKKALLDAADRGIGIDILLSATNDFAVFDWGIKMLARISVSSPKKFNIMVYPQNP